MLPRTKIIQIIAIIVGVALFGYVGSILPRMNTGLFASPDETATSLFANAWTPSNGFKLPVAIHGPSRDVVQLHPRSMVRQGDWFVPVGFLGMPFLVVLMDYFGSYAGDYLTLILVLSSTIPFFFLLRKGLGSFATWASVVIYVSFPTILLYVNRGLFPNLTVVACTLWAVWALRMLSADEGHREKRRERIFFSSVGGIAIGIALFVRPIEALWIVPWIIWAIWPIIQLRNAWKKQIVLLAPFVIGLIVFGVLGAWLSMGTYPFHSSILKQPISGYQLSDYVPSQTVSVGTTSKLMTRDLRSLIPFTIHPRTLWENIRIFWFNEYGIWVGVALMGLLGAWMHWKKRATAIIVLCGWTLFSLLLMYGQSVYTDNISGGATIGNSFLRYLLPMVPLLAIGCALAADSLRRISKRGLLLAVSLIVFLSLYGLAYALSGDSESILATRRELARYAQIRHLSEASIPTDAVILSERSDKIFASNLAWTIVSPIPDEKALTVLRDTEAPVYLFHRLIQTDQDVPASIMNVFTVVADPLVVLDNEALYPIYGLPDTSQ